MVADGAADLEIEPVEDGLVEAGTAVEAGEPAGHGRQAGAFEAVVPLPPLIARGHQAHLAEDPEVPADGRPTDRVVGRQVDDPSRPAGESLEQLPAYGVGESGEGVHTYW